MWDNCVREVRNNVENKRKEVAHIVNEYFKEIEKSLIDEQLLIAKQRNLQRIDDLLKRNKSKLENLERHHDNLTSEEVDIDTIKYVFSKNKQKIEDKVIFETETLIQNESSSVPDSSKVHITLQLSNLPGLYESIDSFVHVSVDMADMYTDGPKDDASQADLATMRQSMQHSREAEVARSMVGNRTKQIFDDDDKVIDGAVNGVKMMKDQKELREEQKLRGEREKRLEFWDSLERPGRQGGEDGRRYFEQLENNHGQRAQLSQNASRR